MDLIKEFKSTFQNVFHDSQKLLMLFVTLSYGVLFSANTLAMTPPEEVVESTISAALQELTDRRDELVNNKAELYVAIERHLQPVINFERISRLVLGKNIRKATEDQKVDFVHHFKKSLLNTYATTLFEYSGEEIIYLTPKDAGKDKVKVPTEFVTQSGERIPVIYSMSNRGDDKWRVYDIKVVLDGASTSLVQLYKSQFNSIISRKGVQGLIDDMKAKHDSDMLN